MMKPEESEAVCRLIESTDQQFRAVQGTLELRKYLSESKGVGEWTPTDEQTLTLVNELLAPPSAISRETSARLNKVVAKLPGSSRPSHARPPRPPKGGNPREPK